MEERRIKKIIWIVALLIIVMSITVAFAVLSTQLQINGTATIDPASWEIRFENLEKSLETGEAVEIEPPDITGDTTIGDFEVILTKPGDSISYTFDVYNAGSIDAKLDTLTKKAMPKFTGLAGDPTDKENDEEIVSNNFSYTLVYTTGEDIVSENDLLPSGARRKMTLTLSYNGTSLPTNDVEISDLGITLLYVQE